jgi:DNA-binding NarL/FixJ family response regulator
MIRVLVADDSAAFRFGLRTMLGAIDDIEVVGDAASGDEAVVRTARLHPDVVVMDLDMATADDGVAATARIAEQSPHVGVLVLTMSAEDAALGGALRAGARGYLVKGAPRDEIERAVRTVAAGGLVVGASLAGRTGALVGAGGPAVAVAALSDREREVLALLADGLANKAIAQRLGISDSTVKFHVNAILGKLGAQSRGEAIAQAARLGLLVL